MYVTDIHQAFTGKRLMKPDAFKIRFAGHKFALDNENDKVVTNAWTAFTESQGYHFPKVDQVCFKPL